MSASTATITYNSFPKGQEKGQYYYHLYGTISLAAGDYVTNGIPLAFSTATGAPNIREPFSGHIWGIAGWFYIFDPAHDTIRIYEQDGSTGGLTEITGALSGEVTGDTIYFDVVALVA